MKSAVLAGCVLSFLASADVAGAADTVRFFTKDGVTYRETRSVTQRPLWETRTETRQETVYREQVKTEWRNVERTSYTPVTECRWQPYWVHRWNPFREPYLAYRRVPCTTLQARREIVSQPVVSRNWVPETRTVQIPVQRQRMVEEEVISRVAVGGHTPTTAVARRVPAGGQQLDNDPPRTASGWREAGSSVMR